MLSDEQIRAMAEELVYGAPRQSFGDASEAQERFIAQQIADVTVIIRRHLQAAGGDDRLTRAVEFIEEQAGFDCHHDRRHGDNCICGPCKARRFLASLPAPPQDDRQANGWQDIASAPKDGTNILVTRVPATTQPPIMIARWGVPRSSEGGARWKITSYIPLRWQPTHWQPLPAPPHDERLTLLDACREAHRHLSYIYATHDDRHQDSIRVDGILVSAIARATKPAPPHDEPTNKGDRT